MKIALTGTRGIPNRYGGFEKFAVELSVRLHERNHKLRVYNPRSHPFKGNLYRGVEILHKRLPERFFGPSANYLYDFSCLKDSVKHGVDAILECGYASAAPWYPLFRRGKTKIITHMDGMEWQRQKWGRPARELIRRAEFKAVQHSDAIVCDHPIIADYYRERYSVDAEMIPYGADIRGDWDSRVLEDMGMEPGSYYLLVARLEPENNIAMIIEGFLDAGGPESLVIVGDVSGRYGRRIHKTYGGEQKLYFMGGMFDAKRLDHLRHYSMAVIHGHSVGGTNPSLLEAMATGALIIAHNNPYTNWVLGEHAAYFSSARELSGLLSGINHLQQSRETFTRHNLDRVRSGFQWDAVVRQYEELFTRLAGSTG